MREPPAEAPAAKSEWQVASVPVPWPECWTMSLVRSSQSCAINWIKVSHKIEHGAVLHSESLLFIALLFPWEMKSDVLGTSHGTGVSGVLCPRGPTVQPQAGFPSSRAHTV